MNEPKAPDAWGTIESVKKNFWCEIRLEDGREIKAYVRKRVVRDAYVLLAGDRVLVRFKQDASPSVVKLVRISE